MYLLDVFEEKNLENIIPVVIDYPFATLVSVYQQRPLISQLPLSYDQEKHCLYGHLARANPHYQCFSEQPQVMVLFQGPNAYVTPTLYESPGVPTWNYVSVEVEGQVELISNHEQQIQILEKQLSQFDPELQSSLLAGLPEARRHKMLEVICGFRIDIGHIQAKFKLSQNRPQQDRQAIVEHYQKLGGDHREQLARFMALQDM